MFTLISVGRKLPQLIRGVDRVFSERFCSKLVTFFTTNFLRLNSFVYSFEMFIGHEQRIHIISSFAYRFGLFFITRSSFLHLERIAHNSVSHSIFF